MTFREFLTRCHAAVPLESDWDTVEVCVATRHPGHRGWNYPAATPSRLNEVVLTVYFEPPLPLELPVEDPDRVLAEVGHS